MNIWRARTTGTAMAQVVLLTAPVGAVWFCVQLLWDEVTTVRLAGVGAVLVLTALAGVWAFRASRSAITVQLVGDKLGIKGRGVHQLGPSSLTAIRAKDGSGSTLGTYMNVTFGNEASRVTLLFSSALPNDHYFAEIDMEPDMWLDPDGNELLDRLIPYLAVKPGVSREAVPGYAFALQHDSLLASGKADSLSIAGDSIAIGSVGRLVAQARAHEIAFTAYAFEHVTSTNRSSTIAPALVLEYLEPPLKLTIGAAPMALEAHWDDLPIGARPEYMLGLGELLRLLSVLEAGRAKYGPR